MTTKNDLLFLIVEKFGTLYYHNVYSFYDEPLIFTALNEYGQLFFCYGLGCDEHDDRWLIAPTSQERVNRLEQKDIPIIKMIKQSASSKVLFVKIKLENGVISEEFISAKDLPYKMPNDDLCISENVNYDGKRRFSHRIRIAKKSDNDIMSETLNQVSEYFGQFCRHYLRKHDISVQFYPQDAVNGSFVYRVKAKSDNDKLFRHEGYQILSRVTSNEDFVKSLAKQEIDLRIVRKLFDLIGSNDIEVQLIDEVSTRTILNLEPEYVKAVVPAIDDLLGTYLDSTMVPQADNLDRLKTYLSIVDRKKIVTAEDLGVDPRQVNYYRDACKVLSLIHDYSTLTPLGWKVANSEIEEEWVGIIQRQFEESDCGHFWMSNQGVKSISLIDEDSATQFLINNCNGLSRDTSERRAQTLKSWAKRFKKISISESHVAPEPPASEL
ncbi:hypothetical protein Rhein_1793 [Rheinheimera sp. A13L]|uniref:DUF6575 domain-containing protein n=1 Tax=Rheinheimera sp. A13L TaxID=506534 RepID=UPI0002124D5F|nr:DUF6575 domain-containing protein [Rheinheimera sp. A13L]EGM78372.1 hypothetical protein Rhein_1793 [Rheinheimera sp. A13L]